MKTTKHTNKLIHESSPYLLQHAHNPVDWYPWGEEALAKAAQEDKPIIVSIGYSACHWCHVMERESFENEAVAELMNQYFVCVKVDREERPDVDQLYMDAAQTMGIQGGWPLNVFLTADQKPFYGGTYFPQENWKQLLQSVADAYAQQRQALVESAEKFTEALNFSEIEKYRLKDSNEALNKVDSTMMFQNLAENFDSIQGGMKGAPKFPMPGIWRFVLHYLSLYKAESTRKQAEKQLATTLNEMASGGIYDQIGGGFSRYSVDKDWFAPHFEKMLYDNGQLVSLYAEAFRLYKNERYRAVVYETLAFVEREMMNAEGGFYAALDADSEGEEGKFYTWTWEEFEDVLAEDTNLWAAYFGVTKEGNWENGRNILHATSPLADFAKKEGLSEEVLKAKLKETKTKLNAIRAERIRPGLDDKVLTGWNGIMLKGVVDAYVSFGEDKFLQLALKNAHFIKEKLFFTSNTLCRTYKEGKAALNGYLEDYAHVIRAYTSLYQVTLDEQWLSISRQLLDYVLEHFYDPDENIFFFTDNSEKLIARKKEIFDNVIPASNSVMAENLYDLGILLDQEDWRRMAERMMAKVKKLVVGEPRYMNNWATAYLKMTHPIAEIATVGPEANRTAIDFGQHPLFNLIFAGTEDASTLPLLVNRAAIDGQKTLYVCYNKACQLPVHNIADALAQVKSR